MIKVYYGCEPYRIKCAISREKDSLMKKGILDSFDIYEGELNDETLELASAPAVMGEVRFLVYRTADLKDRLVQQLIAADCDNEVRVIPDAVDKRTAAFKKIGGAAIEYGRLAPDEFTGFLTAYYSTHPVKILEADFRYLIERIAYGRREDCDLYAVLGWLGVLSALPVVDRGAIDSIVPEYVEGNQFALFDLLVRGEGKQFFRLLDKVGAQSGMIEVFSLIIRSYRIAYKISLVGRSAAKTELGLEAFQLKSITDIPADVCRKCIGILQEGINRLKHGENERVVRTDVFARIMSGNTAVP